MAFAESNCFGIACRPQRIYAFPRPPSRLRLTDSYDYRNAKAILETRDGKTLSHPLSILNDRSIQLRVTREAKKNRDISRQIQEAFRDRGWTLEKALYTLPELRYDLQSGEIVAEIEIGHERLVYAVFLDFLADYSANKIPVGVIIVTTNPTDFGQNWHNSVEATKKKLLSVQNSMLVPMLVLGISP